MALMTVLEIPVVPVVVPFVQVTHVSDGVGVQTGKGFLHGLVFLTQDLAGCDGVDKEFADDGEVGGTAIAGHTVIAFIRLILILR